MNQHRIEIFAPRYEGERFKDHRFPLDFLEDLKILQEMTTELAKYVFKDKNRGRERILRNFTSGISFELESIEKGSTIPKIVLITAMTGMFPDHNATYFEQASKRIIRAIQAVNAGEDVHQFLPDHVLDYFNRFGKKLGNDEFIEFLPESEPRAKFTKETRKKLILASSKTNEYTEEILVRGMITAMDKLKSSFEIQTINFQKIRGYYTPENLDSLQQGFVKLEEKQKLLIKATGFFNRSGRLESINEIEEIVLLEEFDVPARLEELALLKDGWLNGEGVPPNKVGIEWLVKNFDENFDPSLPLPATFPTPDGNIQFEWSFADYETSLTVDLKTRKAVYTELMISTSSDHEDEIDLNTEEGWRTLNQSITSNHIAA